MVRLLPARLISALAQAIELSALSQELDQALLERLPRADGVFHRRRILRRLSRAFGARGARAPDRADRRSRRGLDVYVRRPFIESGLSMMRQPARLAGLARCRIFWSAA
jgi:hypothetical protein